jgi:NAD(P)-dependent dehydrogenase (short-subunit alcohol dehydrogenase family)
MVVRSALVAPGIAFVTGGARGLGNAIGVSFAKDGAKGVVLVDILDDDAFEEGKKAVEKYGAEVGKSSELEGQALISAGAMRQSRRNEGRRCGKSVSGSCTKVWQDRLLRVGRDSPLYVID